MTRVMNRVSALTIALAALSATATVTAAQDAVRIGTSSVGSNFYRLAVGMGEVINKKAGINTTVQAVGGSAATVRGIGAKRVEFGISSAFSSVTAFEGTYSFEKGGKLPIVLVLQGGYNHRGIVVRKGAGVKTLKDLEGKTFIGKRRALPELELITTALFKAAGVDISKVKIVETTNTSQVLKNLAIGTVDGAIIPHGPRAGNIQKAFSDGGFTFINFPLDQAKASLKDLPKLISIDVQTKDWYDGLTEDTPVFAMSTTFVTNIAVPEDTVYKVAKTILENGELFKTYHHQAKDWTLANALSNFQQPFHPGSIRYFKEKGAWTAEHEKHQKELMALLKK
jgi:TRAP transporter TAXI family solute receptor